jgi:hypothetical protein
MPYLYDVFLSHTGKDKPAIREIRSELERRGLKAFLDEEDLRGGGATAETLTAAMKASRSILIVVGPHPVSWGQDLEMKIAIQPDISAERPVVLALLPFPGARDRVPLHLRTNIYRALTSLRNQKEIDALFTDLMGRDPPPPGEEKRDPGPAADPRLLEQAVIAVADGLGSTGATFFLGERAAHDEAVTIPTMYKVTRRLLTDIDFIPAEYGEHLPTLDAAGTQYALRKSVDLLELSVTNGVVRPDVPPTHQWLASLLKYLRQNRSEGRGRRGRPTPPLLVITTNYDNDMERALLMEGVPFTRIVQHRPAPPGPEPRVEWHVYDFTNLARLEDGSLRLGEHPDSVPPDDPDALDAVIENHPGRKFWVESNRLVEVSDSQQALTLNMEHVVVYKYHGSYDVAESCTISTDQYLEFVEHRHIPPAISVAIQKTQAVFLGYLLLDPPFRHMLLTLLRQPFHLQTMQPEIPRKYFLYAPPAHATPYPAYDRFERHNWETTQAGINSIPRMQLLEQRPEIFFLRLLERLRAQDPDR